MGYKGDTSRDYKYYIIVNDGDTVDVNGDNVRLGGTVYFTENENKEFQYDIKFSFNAKSVPLFGASRTLTLLLEYNSDEEGDNYTESGFIEDITTQDLLDLIIDDVTDSSDDWALFMSEIKTTSWKNANPKPPEPDPPSKEPITEPTFTVFADKSDVTGEISFYQLEGEYYGELNLKDFPEGLKPTYTCVTNPVSEPEYETLKNEALQKGQEYLDGLKTDDLDLGVLKELENDGYKFKISGKVVDSETQEPLVGVKVEHFGEEVNKTEYTNGPFFTGQFTIESFYVKDDSPPTTPENPDPVYELVYEGAKAGFIEFEKVGLERQAKVQFYTQIKTKFPNKQILIEFLGIRSATGTNQELGNQAFIELQNRVRNETDEVDPEKIKKQVSNEPYIDDTLIRAVPFSLEVSFEDYNSTSVQAVNADGTVKTSVGVIELVPLVTTIDEDKMAAEDYNEEQIGLLEAEIDKGFVTTQLEKLLNKIKQTLIPTILAMLVKFGLSELSKLKDKANVTPQDLMKKGATCPANIEELEAIIDKKNKLTKQIDNLYGGIEKIDNFINPLKTLVDSTKIGIDAAKIAALAIANIPSTVGTPIPSGAYYKLGEAITILDDLIDVTDPKIGQATFQLNFLKSNIGVVLNLLNMLDMMIGKCADEFGLEDNDQRSIRTQISDELLALTKKQEEEGSPVVPSVNGFTMEVITIEGTTIGGLQRRQAIAKNPAGITMIKGDPSFSSVDQILIDELAFYIKQNDLKAE